MKALVTGATGFIGGSVVRELLRRGYQVRAMIRPGASPRPLAGLDVELVPGDLLDRASLDKAVDGCDTLFHVAAAYALWTPDPELVYATNVQGTGNVLAAALTKGIKRVVYTSTESTIGIAKNGSLGTEEMETRLGDLPGHYKKSKYLAEKLALGMCREGLPLVVVNPTTPVGWGDVKPTPTGQFVVDFLNGRMPAYVNTGMNFVDVEDVAKGHVLALEKGRVGERYVLGNKNLRFREVLGILEQIAGVKAPGLRLPIWLALGAAYVDEFVLGSVTQRPPRIPVAGVKAARKFRYFDCSKAIQELGLPQTPVEEALEKAVRWFRENGQASW